MELVATTRRIESYAGDAAVQFLLEYLISKRVPRECELCAEYCGTNDIFNCNDPGIFFACMIRGPEA